MRQTTRTVTTMPNLSDRLLDLAAGTAVDSIAYNRHNLNLARLQAMGKAYRQGWLHNLLRRVTPITTRSADDYIQMADLFITSPAEATNLLQHMSADLSAFATAAGYYATPHHVPAEMFAHLRLYRAIGQLLENKFGIKVPAPFASTTVDASLQRDLPFIRQFMSTRH